MKHCWLKFDYYLLYKIRMILHGKKRVENSHAKCLLSLLKTVSNKIPWNKYWLKVECVSVESLDHSWQESFCSIFSHHSQKKHIDWLWVGK